MKKTDDLPVGQIMHRLASSPAALNVPDVHRIRNSNLRKRMTQQIEKTKITPRSAVQLIIAQDVAVDPNERRNSHGFQSNHGWWRVMKLFFETTKEHNSDPVGTENSGLQSLC